MSSSCLQVETHLPTTPPVGHSLFLAEINESDEDNIESPNAPQYSPISMTDEILPNSEDLVLDGNDGDEEAHMTDNETEIESNVSNLPLHV